MIDFVLRSYTDLIFGRGKEARVGQLIQDFGGTKVLIHHPDEPFVRPIVEKVKGYLTEAGLEWVELGGVVANPRLDLVYTGIELCRREHVDFLLAIGGGSTIDSTKGIGIGVPYNGDVWDIYDAKVQQQECLPIGVISTFAGTGSEMTFGSVITRGLMKRGIEDPDDHVTMRPKFVILNPEFTFTVPKFQTASGIGDLLTHLTENFFTRNPDNDLSDELAYAGLRTVLKYGPIVMEHPTDYEARGQLMVLSPLAICGIMKVGRWGDWGCHDIEHEMSGEWDIPHGVGLAIIMPVWMRYVMQDLLPSFVKFAVNVFNIPLDMEHMERTAQAGINAYAAFLFDVLGLPKTLTELGVPPEKTTDPILRKVAHQVFYKGNKTCGRTRPLDEDDVYHILKQCV